MTYKKVTKEEAKKVIQDVYKYMPTMAFVNGGMCRIVAQQNGVAFYTTEELDD